jgi:hypothetical protein
MASRGRPINPLRAAAREAGEKFYADQVECSFCGTNKRYVSNAGCVACAISRGSARYASLDDAGKAAQAAHDHERYLKRMAKNEFD